MASEKTLALRQEKLYTKNGTATLEGRRQALIAFHRRRWDDKHGPKVQEKAAREVEVGVKDSRSATA